MADERLKDFDKTWESLQIKNDYIFSKVMRDKEICIALLEKLLKLKIKDIQYLEEEKTINIEYAAKSVRLDVYVEEGNRVFNLEMQATSQSELPYRSRYYQAIIDLNSIEKGEDYDELKESYVIFICTFDPFGSGLAQYTFENLCKEDTTIRLNDGTKKIFFNAKDYEKAENEDVREFLRYVNGEKSDNPFVQIIDNKVVKVKSSKEWRREYMTLMMRDRENHKQGMKEGKREERRKIISKMILQGFDDEQIMMLCETTKEEIKLCREGADSAMN